MLRSKKLLLIPFIFCLFLFFHTSCKKEEIKRIIKVTTDEVTECTAKSATVRGTIVDIGEGITEHGFCWSTTNNPTIELTTITQLGSKNSKGSFTGNLTNLTPNTTYYIRSYASDGETVKYGNEKIFKTESQTLASITTGTISEITDSSATVTATISDFGNGIDTVIQYGFCWSANQNPTIENDKTELGSKSSTGEFSSNLVGLSPGTTYYLKAYATNSVGTAYGNEINFTTSAILPTVTTSTASDITYNSATCGGNVTDDGGASITARGVCWSTSQNPTISDSYTTDGTGTGSFSSSITGLSQVTTYYVRAFATNSEGTAYGDEVSFITIATVPTVTTISASSITENSAESGGNVTDDGGATVTARGVCWSSSQNPTISGSYTSDGSGTGSFSSSITGLSPVTTYYVRAYATNNVGTAYGNENVFTTKSFIEKPSIVFCTNWDGNYNLYYMNPDGSGIERLTDATANESYPRWSPDCSKIAFTANYDGNYDIYVMNPDGSNLQNLTQNPAHEEYLTWSPDGSRIAFSSNRDGNVEIYIINADGSGQIRLTYSDTEDSYHMDWSPDGNWIVFSRTTTRSLPDGHHKLYVTDTEGLNVYELTSNNEANMRPAWSYDGSKIAFTSFRDGNYWRDQIWVGDFIVTGGIPSFSNETNISNNSLRHAWPRWSPNDTKIIHTRCPYNTWNNTIYIMNADGSDAVQITTQAISGPADWK